METLNDKLARGNKRFGRDGKTKSFHESDLGEV